MKKILSPTHTITIPIIVQPNPLETISFWGSTNGRASINTRVKQSSLAIHKKFRIFSLNGLVIMREIKTWYLINKNINLHKVIEWWRGYPNF